MCPNAVWAPTNVTRLPTSLLRSHHGPTDATHVSYDLYTRVWDIYPLRAGQDRKTLRAFGRVDLGDGTRGASTGMCVCEAG